MAAEKNTETQTSGYEITVKGQYYANDGKTKILKNYGPEKFFLPEQMEIQTGYHYVMKKIDGRPVKEAQPKRELVNSHAWAQHIIQRLLLPARLTERYPDSNGHRTCTVIDSRRVSQAPKNLRNLKNIPIAEMSVPELKQFTALEGVFVPFENFASVEDMRIATQDAINDRDNTESAKNKKESLSSLSTVSELPVTAESGRSSEQEYPSDENDEPDQDDLLA